MNIAFYVSGKAGRLQRIIDLQDPDVLKRTKLIFSDDKQNSFLQQKIEGNDIAYHCLHYPDIVVTDKPKGSVMSDKLLELLKEYAIDYCFSFGGHLLSGSLLQEYENRIINFHPSILPLFPGLNAIDQALAASSNLLGNTAHFIDAGVDTGSIIMQNIVTKDLFIKGGYDAILDQQIPMFLQIFRWLEAGRLQVADGVVAIKDSVNDQIVFFPAIDSDKEYD